MKHTFVLIDSIMILIAKVPPKLESEKDIIRARLVLDKIIEYNWQLEKLITAHGKDEHLTKLHQYHIDNIPDWSERVYAQFEKLKELMKVLHEDIPKLKTIINKGRTNQNIINSNEWSNKIGDMSMGFLMAGFHDAECNMIEFRKAEIFEVKHLLKIIGDNHTISLFQNKHNHDDEAKKKDLIEIVKRLKAMDTILQ